MSHFGLLAMVTMVLWGVVLPAEASEGESILYRGNPDVPFEGAWGEPDIDCGDPHGVEESDCWQCEGGSPPIALPKFEWHVVRECPTFSISPEVTTSCRCDPSGSRNQYSCSADYTAKDGRKYYLPSIEGCGGPPPPEEPITQTVKWKWHTQGLPTEPSSGEGPTASFEYTVPEGPFSIDVYFQAETEPIDKKCDKIVVGPQLHNQIDGEGYKPYRINPQKRKYPTITYVDGYVDSAEDGSPRVGRAYYHFSGPVFWCQEGCLNNCTVYRLEGNCGAYELSIKISKSIEVIKDGCDLPKGAMRPRSEEAINATIEHEYKHFDVMWDFLDEWNNELSALGFFSTCEEAMEAGREFCDRFALACVAFRKRRKSHCPHFAGERLYSVDKCGNEALNGRVRQCP